MTLKERRYQEKTYPDIVIEKGQEVVIHIGKYGRAIFKLIDELDDCGQMIWDMNIYWKTFEDTLTGEPLFEWQGSGKFSSFERAFDNAKKTYAYMYYKNIESDSKDETPKSNMDDAERMLIFYD